jgi:hypothetical protein
LDADFTKYLWCEASLIDVDSENIVLYIVAITPNRVLLFAGRAVNNQSSSTPTS